MFRVVRSKYLKVFLNASYIFGPISAGLLGDMISIPIAFSALGAIGVVWAIVLYTITPKHINVKNVA